MNNFETLVLGTVFTPMALFVEALVQTTIASKAKYSEEVEEKAGSIRNVINLIKPNGMLSNLTTPCSSLILGRDEMERIVILRT